MADENPLDEAKLAETLSRIETRLTLIEAQLGYRRSSAQGPPPLEPPPRLVQPGIAATQTPRPPQPARNPTEPHWPPGADPTQAKAKTNEEWEYQIGARVLPISAAIAILAAIGYLVSLGLSRAWITPAMLFGAVCAGCLVFIVAGLIKQNEREQFGQVLAGIGSCGLYLNFVAGHVFQKLYVGEVLVALFIALSLLNLGYAWWRASPAFLGIGLIGGFSSAFMPLSKENAVMSAALNLAILVPVVAVSIRHKWPGGTIWAYCVSTGGLFAAIMVAVPEARLVVGIAFLVTAVLGAGGYLVRTEDGADPKNYFAFGALIVNSLATVATLAWPAGGLAVLALALVVAGGSRLLQQEERRIAALASGVTLALIVAPFDIPLPERIWAFTAIAAASALWSLMRPDEARFAVRIGTVAWVLAGLTYSYMLDSALPGRPLWADWRGESLTLAGMVLAGALLCWGMTRCTDKPEAGAMVWNLVLGVQTIRISENVFQHGLGTFAWVGIVVGGFVFAVVLAAQARRLHWAAAAVLSWLALVFGLVFLAAAQPKVAMGGELVLLLVGLLVTGVVWSSSKRGIPTHEQVQLLLGANLSGLLVARMAYLLLQSAFDQDVRVCVALCMTGFLALALSRFLRVTMLAWVAAIFLVETLAYYVSRLAEAGNGLPLGYGEVGLLGAMLVLTAVCGSTLYRTDPNAVAWTGSLFAWFLMSRLGFLVLPNIGLSQGAAITSAWTLTALVLFAVGMVKEVQQLRFAAFTLLALTTCKVIVVDLVNVDQVIKVVILMFLGLVMLASGYWYIRRQARLEARTKDGSEGVEPESAT